MDIKRYIESGLLEQYVLGLTSIEESVEVEEYAERYPEVRTKIKRLQSCMNHYANAHAINPPQKLKKKILSKIDGMDECKMLSIEHKKQKGAHAVIAQPSFFARYSSMISGLAAIMIIGFAAFSFMMYQKQNEANQKITILSDKMNQLQTDHTSLTAQNKELLAQYEMLKDVSTRQVHLRGMDLVPQALAVVYYNPEHKNAFLNIVNLPAAPHGHQYQLWADVDGKHMNMGTLTSNPNPQELQTVPFMDNSQGFAITLEKEGGSIEPTVAKLCLAGNINL